MTELKSMRVVLTGATGFLGRNAARELLAQGARVFAVVRPDSKHLDALPQQEGLTLVRRALNDADGMMADIGHADAFLHYAWGGVNREQIDSPVVQEANIQDSLCCLRTARALGCHTFMDAGSRVEYGITPDGTMREDMPCHPVNEYGKAKLRFFETASGLCADGALSYAHLRFFSVYGVGDHPWSIISTLTRELPKGAVVPLSACMHRWNFMHVDDASRAVAALLRCRESYEGKTCAVNIASDDTRRLKAFVETIHALCGGLGTPEYGVFEQAKEGALSICPDITMLKTLTLGTWREQITFEQGIRAMLEAGAESQRP